ncbi:MAG: Na+/H+ antiporter subunit E [Candidatus Marinimicrobia bacterium]|nr:Na+/H+ antiporter subunit E [Candidatus Neomarinimicrobiota bacterium]
MLIRKDTKNEKKGILMKKLKHSIILFVILMAFWILFTSLDIQEVITGAITSFIITIMLLSLKPILADIKLNPKSLIYSIIYIFVFIWELIKSNIDVAKRVISPKLPINPGIVKVKTKLKSPLGRAILANSITLTPGTLTVEMIDDHFYIHWIDVESEDIEGATKSIVSKFEKYLEVIFG